MEASEQRYEVSAVGIIFLILEMMSRGSESSYLLAKVKALAKYGPHAHPGGPCPNCAAQGGRRPGLLARCGRQP